MDMPPDSRLGLDIKRAEHALMSAKSGAVKAADLTVAQYAALLALAQNPGMSAAALARACLVTPQAMTAVLKNLEGRGLIERSAHPWHQKMLETRLTDAGRQAVELADRQAVRIERRLADAFTEEERDSLRALLARCVQAIRSDG
ncbi:MarR family transcriptional regulator [Streptomyces cinnamoneus]|uniref:MarR family winged helix-turn-helix transcriptional regulator n=1 Tax=Streptomyces TaxID=1883 RepID=UPI001CE3549F|nr:MarR family transcriptional regulator [Streptomyces sichuanensis]MCA6095111.1 MarR family transcriptional regulator [Streptomyces sichuanensis]